MSSDADTVRHAIRGYITSLNGRGDHVADDHDIIQRGIIASIQLLDLINYVADTWNVEIEEAHVFDGHFATVESIVGFVTTRAAA